MKFEERPQEEIERQRRCGRGDAWRLAKNILKLKDADKATFFFSPTMVSPSAFRNETGGKRICCRFQRIRAQVEQEGPELCRVGNP